MQVTPLYQKIKKANVPELSKHFHHVLNAQHSLICFEMSGVDGRRVISKVILSSVEGSHLLTPIVCLFDIGVVCFYNMTDIRSDDHYNSDECVPGYSFGR